MFWKHTNWRTNGQADRQTRKQLLLPDSSPLGPSTSNSPWNTENINRVTHTHTHSIFYSAAICRKIITLHTVPLTTDRAWIRYPPPHPPPPPALLVAFEGVCSSVIVNIFYTFGHIDFQTSDTGLHRFVLEPSERLCGSLCLLALR